MTGSTHYFHNTELRAAELDLTSYSAWSPYFADHVVPAKVITPVPTSFVDYLNSESIRLPPPKYEEPLHANSDNEYSDWEDENVESNPTEAFSEFHAAVEAAFQNWPRVIVKLNFSAPKDAKWMMINNLIQCTSARDIYMLLNASDHVAHDLDMKIYDECSDSARKGIPLEVVIKKWIDDFNPALEFRIFVRNRKIVGVSQRDMNHYQYLATLQPAIKRAIQQFNNDTLQTTEYPLRNFIMDVYIPRPHRHVIVLDINPWSHSWDTYLFTWNELEEKDNDGDFDVRIITETNIGSLARKDYSESQVPIEVVDASMNADAMVELARTWNVGAARGQDCT